jgi:anti-anti-sigma regulatory factor
MANGVAVVTASAQIDVTTAEQLRVLLLRAGSHGPTTFVVDLTRTLFCDSAGLGRLDQALDPRPAAPPAASARRSMV